MADDTFEQLLQRHQQESQRLRAAMEPAPEPAPAKVPAVAPATTNDLLEDRQETPETSEAEVETKVPDQDSIQLKMSAPKRSNSNMPNSPGVADPGPSGRFYRRVRSR